MLKFNDLSPRRTMAGERSARSRSSKARTMGTVKAESFTAPIRGTMWRSTPDDILR